MPRLALPARYDLPEEYQYLLSEDGLGDRNIFRVFGNNPPVLKSYMLYGNTLWEECGLNARERELVILTIARSLGSRYEWQQHVDIAQEAGVTNQEIGAIGRKDLETFGDQLQSVLEYAEAFACNEVTDAAHERIEEHFDQATVVGVGLLSSHYVATALALDAFDVPLEDEFVGWELEGAV